MSAAADLILRDVRPHGGAATDIAIRDGIIIAVAPRLAFSGSEIEGQGRDIIPGLHDHHLHLFATAAQRDTVDLSGCNSSNAICASLREHAVRHPGDGWIRASGLTATSDQLPDRHDLDRWIADRPIRIQDRTGALWLLNSKALRAIGSGPWPSCVECDYIGMPNGRIWRGDVWLRSVLALQPPSLSMLSRELAAFGVTHVTDAGAANGAEEVRLFETAVSSGKLLQRLMMMGREDLPCSTKLAQGPLKLLYDEPSLPDLSEVVPRIATARRQGRAVAAHCVTLGELAFFLAALDASGGARSGDRVEHGSVIPETLLGDIAKAGLTVVTQPGFVRTRGDRYRKTVDRDEVENLYRLGSLIDAGIPVLAGSDAPYGNIDPWQAIDAAIRRTTASGAVIGKTERVALHQALSLFSTNHLIVPGIPADLCLLSISLSELANGVASNPVAITLIGGEVAADHR
jgi:predicted amidohydrolase YtcJ